MNLSPDWVPWLQECGWEARHWSQLGAGNAPDHDLMAWAREHDHVVLTQDLDFPQLLFSSGEKGPSVVLLRMKDEFAAAAREHVIRALDQARDYLASGALMVVSDQRVRLRRLPVAPSDH